MFVVRKYSIRCGKFVFNASYLHYRKTRYKISKMSMKKGSKSQVLK